MTKYIEDVLWFYGIYKWHREMTARYQKATTRHRECSVFSESVYIYIYLIIHYHFFSSGGDEGKRRQFCLSVVYWFEGVPLFLVINAFEILIGLSYPSLHQSYEDDRVGQESSRGVMTELPNPVEIFSVYKRIREILKYYFKNL